MKRRLIVTAIALSLASGFYAITRGQDKVTAETLETCPVNCCEDGPEGCQPKCCAAGEMCCE